jgi:hypothetical protein
MPRPTFLPTARETNVLLVAGFLALGYALYIRYTMIENSAVSIACKPGAQAWVCTVRLVTIALFQNAFFGALAVAAALLNLLRPHVVLAALALASGAAGLVLYNTWLSAFAIALLIISLARPRIVPEQA